MIKYVKGNILESDAEALVNPVNCVGVMGAGLAKQFKAKYPEMFDKYKELCKQGKFHGGHIHIYQIKGKRRFIINFATKVHWKDKAKLDYIKFGLGTLVYFLKYTPLIKSIAIPALGCGDGDDFYNCPFVLKCPVFTDDAPCDWTDIKDEEE